MAAISDYLEAALLNHVLRNTPYAQPATVYLALYTAAPSDAGGGTEVSGGGYARQAITFGAPASGQVQNSAAITFPQATADWGTITHVGIFDAGTAGNLLWWGALAAAKTIVAGDQFVIDVNQLTVSLD